MFAAMDRVGDFLREKTVRRVVAVALFALALGAFRPLFLMFVFFVAFERALAASSGFVQTRLRLKPRASVLVVLGVLAAIVSVGLLVGVERVARAVVSARDTFPHRLEAIRESDLYLRAREHLPDADRVVDSLQHHAEDALHFVAALGHLVAYATIGLILAFHRTLAPRSLIGTLVRWFEHAADAIAVTIQLQLIVALFNTVTTLPVLLLLGVHHVVALMILVFFSALVPVVGNFVSGVVLSLLAFGAKGWWGVGIFVVLTFVLHKIEAYYLNPRLTARHVKLPGFVLIVSLLAFEHLFGFVGLFLSFPFLFVAGRIRTEWRAEDEASAALAPEPGPPAEPSEPKRTGDDATRTATVAAPDAPGPSPED
jgi:predicted PurR-regulated permease PerM